MLAIKYAVVVSWMSVVASKIQEDCVLVTSSNVLLHDVYCEVIPYEIDIGRMDNTTRLDLSGNRIRTLCVTSNRNSSLGELDLSHNDISGPCSVQINELVRIDSIVLSYNRVKNFSMCSAMRNMTISWNHIQSLSKADMVNATSLEALDLGHNVILWIENDTFAGLPDLQWLNLRGNMLSRISEKTLPSVTLRHLDLSENYLLDPSTAFQPFESLVELNIAQNVHLAPAILGSGLRLQALDVSRTNLTEVPATPAPLLGSLSLGGNAIQTIRSGDLDGFPLLRTLNISSNRISSVEEDAFGRLDLLTVLDLSGNLLDAVPKSLPGGLEILDLSVNRIHNLTAEDFLGCGRLKVLNVRNNGLKHVQDFSLTPLKFLDVLDLSDNPIEFITREMLTGPVRLKELNMKGMDALETPAFPFTDTQYLNKLRLSNSTHLAAILFNDSAVLSSMFQLEYLDVTDCGVKTLPDRLPYYMPKMISLITNDLECTGPWLKEWLCEIHSSWDNQNPRSDTTEVRLRSFLPTPKKSPSEQLQCTGADGQLRGIYDPEYCANQMTTTSMTPAVDTFTTEQFAVFERLRAKNEPKAPDEAHEATHPGVVVFFFVVLLLILLALGTVWIGVQGVPLKRMRWKQSPIDVDYQSIEIKSLESLNHVERW
ncbi:insulin-like growth factor-binding protein complex acid labile subunit [Adelges cooleyi]|uniref:insulin-like growth factor-binding protein complex acid labile subunit n=1 Tax=Adelges cooleyi TaxID=133065 RepID=UPI00217F4F98|nr:insulin-like growth factor-binding protein complex acid labile subunit [Adelges cooleyi]